MTAILWFRANWRLALAGLFVAVLIGTHAWAYSTGKRIGVADMAEQAERARQAAQAEQRRINLKALQEAAEQVAALRARASELETTLDQINKDAGALPDAGRVGIGRDGVRILNRIK